MPCRKETLLPAARGKILGQALRMGVIPSRAAWGVNVSQIISSAQLKARERGAPAGSSTILTCLVGVFAPCWWVKQSWRAQEVLSATVRLCSKKRGNIIKIKTLGSSRFHTVSLLAAMLGIAVLTHITPSTPAVALAPHAACQTKPEKEKMVMLLKKSQPGLCFDSSLSWHLGFERRKPSKALPSLISLPLVSRPN